MARPLLLFPPMVGGIFGWIEYVARCSRELLEIVGTDGSKLTSEERGFLMCWTCPLISLIEIRGEKSELIAAFCVNAMKRWKDCDEGSLRLQFAGAIDDTRLVLTILLDQQNESWRPTVEVALEFFRVLEEQAHEELMISRSKQ